MPIYLHQVGGIRERVKLQTSNLAATFNDSQGPTEQKPVENFGNKGAWAYLGTAQFFEYPYYVKNG